MNVLVTPVVEVTVVMLGFVSLPVVVDTTTFADTAPISPVERTRDPLA